MNLRNIVPVKLSGWQRLLVVVAVLWLFPVLIFGYAAWPGALSISKADVYAQLGPENGRGVIDYYDVLAAKHGGSVKPSDGIDFTPDEGPTVQIDGHLVQFIQGVSEDQMNRTGREYYEALSDLLATQRATFAGQVAAVWAVPALALYALGWAVAWVRRGFAS